VKSFTIDSSVIVKFILPDKPDEDHQLNALHLMKLIQGNTIRVLQPVHWLPEIAAVIVRSSPRVAAKAIATLVALAFPILNELEVYELACELSEKLDHHLFDTLYHAVALYSGHSTFITADEKYYKKAKKYGHIVSLAEFNIFEHIEVIA